MLIDCPSCSTSFRIAPEALGPTGRSVRCANCRTVWHASRETMRAEAVADPTPKAATSASKTVAEDDAGWGDAFREQTASSPKADRDTPRSSPAAEATPEVEAPPLAPVAPANPLPVSAVAAAQPKVSRMRAINSTIASAAQKTMRRRALPDHPRPSFRLSLPTVIVILGAALLSALFVGRDHVVRTVPDAASVYETVGLPVNLRGVDFREVRGSSETADGVVVLVVEGTLVNITSREIPLQRLRLAVRDAQGREIYTWTAAAPKAVLAPGESVAFRSRLASPPPDGRSIEVRFFNRRDAGGA